MKKQMKRTVYEAPVTERFQVELEGTFCASVINDQHSSGVETTDQEVTVVQGSQWDETPWA